MEFAPGMILIDEDRTEYEVVSVTSRIVLVRKIRNDTLEPAVSHAFANAKYRAKEIRK